MPRTATAVWVALMVRSLFRKTYHFFLPGLFLFISLACNKENDPSQLVLTSLPPGSEELMVYSDTINWNWELGEFYGGNSFYWWHNTASGHLMLGEMPSDCWTKPHNFELGQFYLRFEVLEQPSDQAFFVQVGIWQDIGAEEGYSETISSRILVENGSGSLVEADLGSPADWWELKPDKEVDFCKVAAFDRIGLALWKADPLCLPMGQGWHNGNACDNPEQAALAFFPMKVRISMVAVAEGYDFGGWDAYP